MFPMWRWAEGDVYLSGIATLRLHPQRNVRYAAVHPFTHKYRHGERTIVSRITPKPAELPSPTFVSASGTRDLSSAFALKSGKPPVTQRRANFSASPHTKQPYYSKMAQQNRETIVVIGAGILGITSAVALQERLPSSKYQIAIIASHFPTDPYHPSYATTNAGAHFRPIPGTTPQLKYEARLAQVAYERFKKTAIEQPEFGVRLLEGIEYIFGDAAPIYTAMEPDYVSQEGFRLLEGAEKPAGAKYAASYQTYTVDPETYTFHLLRQFRLNGGQLLRKHLHSVEEVYRLPDFNASLVVNCSGMGFGDPNCFPIRGQTCLIAKTCDHTVTQQNADGSWTFIVPRPLNGGTIVGGTKEPKDWNPTPSIEVRNELIRKVAKMYPDILNEDGKVDVVRDVVGRRPAREGGLRLEIERISNQKNVVHAYGVGGRGFELSWGIAGEVISMVNKALNAPLRSQL